MWTVNQDDCLNVGVEDGSGSATCYPLCFSNNFRSMNFYDFRYLLSENQNVWGLLDFLKQYSVLFIGIILFLFLSKSSNKSKKKNTATSCFCLIQSI